MPVLILIGSLLALWAFIVWDRRRPVKPASQGSGLLAVEEWQTYAFLALGSGTLGLSCWLKPPHPPFTGKLSWVDALAYAHLGPHGVALLWSAMGALFAALAVTSWRRPPAEAESTVPEPAAAKGPRQISRDGITTDSPMPEGLPFAAALRQLMADRDHRSVQIGIDPAAFYSEEAIELHNFVDGILCRFVTEEAQPFLAYEISTRYGGIYREVAYDGQVLREWHVHVIDVPGEAELLQGRSERMALTLGRG